MKIKLSTVSDVSEFVNICSTYHNANIDVKQGRHVINGKSILGVFSLNLLEPLNVEIEVEKADSRTKFIKDIERWREKL